jgi:hypothetical protein
MPAQSKSQQRFFGVVKAMQKGDIPKKGKAGKAAKSMTKKDVDDFASTKHKGKPEKVKREQRVRELIKKMVREELTQMNEGLKRFSVYVSGQSKPLVLMGKDEKEVKQTAHMMLKNSSVKIRKVVKEGKLTEAKKFRVYDTNTGKTIKVVNSEKAGWKFIDILYKKYGNPDAGLAKVYEEKLTEAIGKGMFWKDLKVGTSIEFTGGTAYVVTKIDKNKLKMNLKRRGKVGGNLFAGGNIGLDKKSFESQVKVGLIKYLINTNPRIKEGTCGYGENGELGEQPAGPHLIKKKEIEEGKGVDKVLDMANNNSFGKLGGKTVDAMSANLFKKVYDKANDASKEKIDKMNEKQLYVFMTKLWSKFSKQVRI